MKKITTLALVAGMLLSCSQQKEAKKFSPYPETRKEMTVDTLFGTPVADPYRWLENDTTQETKDWVAAENKVTFGYLESIPFRGAVRARLNELQNYEKLTAPHREGEYYYYSRNSGLQNQSVQYRRQGESGAEEVFLDPNTFSTDGTTSLANMIFSKDGSLVACMIQEGGSDWRKVVVLKTNDKTIVGDTITGIKFGGVAWRGNEGFYYSNYGDASGNQLFAKVDYNKVQFHALGTPQKNDKLVFDGNMKPQRRASAGLTEDERYLIVATFISGSGNELYLQDLKDPKGKLNPVITNFDNQHDVIATEGSKFIVKTNLNAPNDKIVAFDYSKPGVENWKDVVPESESALRNVSTAGKKLFLNYLKDASTVIMQYNYSGQLERIIELPGIGSAGGFDGREGDKEVYYTFTSYTTPTSIYRYDITSGKSTSFGRPTVDFDPDGYETKQVFYESKDGTKIPMFIVHKKGLELNGKNPTYLYGYGGFAVSQTPTFSANRILWLENGGVYAHANLRGGGEYGERWHDAGRLLNKQNVFDDFIAAAEYLIREKYTSSDYLAIAGGSNGGLLVGATMTQRPDLAKVALPAVGVMDMLRYHKFTVGGAWAYDYGKAEDSKEMFEYLLKYSPLHALKPGTSYPATLVTTADHDDRVLPAHSFKFAATLQAANASDEPVLIRIETKSGHGSSNLSKALDVTADQYSFAWHNMGVTPPLAKKAM